MKDMLVKDAMTHLVVTLRPHDPLHVAAERLSKNGISGAPVVEDGKVVGLLSESDIIRATMAPAPIDRGMSVLEMVFTVGRPHLRDKAEAPTVGEAMTTVVVKVEPKTSIWTAAALMERRGIKRLPVVDKQGFLVGIISRADVVRMMGRPDDTIREDVIEAVRVLGDDTLGDFDVEVEDGVVSLTGKVDRKTTARIAVQLARHIPGAVEVHDRLTFEWDDSKISPTLETPGRLTSLHDHIENRDWVATER
jgi:CBS domain-containing protein